MEHITRHPAIASVGLATAELILAIQHESPHVRLVPCEPIEGEDIHLWAYLPMEADVSFAIVARVATHESF